MSHHHGHGHSHGHIAPPEVVDIDTGVYAYIQPDGTWWINNCGILAGAGESILVDTCSTERRTRVLLETVNQIEPGPIRAVVNTHHHGDHTHGNWLTRPAAIIGHRRCREAILSAGLPHFEGVFSPVDWGDIELAPPMVTFEDRIDVHIGDIRAELHYIGTPAHTTNDIVVWLPDRRVLFTGDLVFNGGTPFMVMGSVTGSLAALEHLSSFDADVVVPGHGPVCDMTVIERLRRYDEFILDVATRAVNDGVSPLEAARDTDLGEFSELSDSERLVGNLHRAMFELAGAEPGAPIDLVAAIGDMVAYNGGKPLTCLA
jgi:cyclase